MGRKKTTKAEEQGTPPTPPPDFRRYKYIGPPGRTLRFPPQNLTIRPDGLTDAQIEALINEHPPLRQYFQQDRAGEEE